MFGFLVFMFVFVVGIGGVLYVLFIYKICGYLFYFDKMRKFCGGFVFVSEWVLSFLDDFDFEDEEEVMIRGVLSIKNENFLYWWIYLIVVRKVCLG